MNEREFEFICRRLDHQDRSIQRLEALILTMSERLAVDFAEKEDVAEICDILRDAAREM